MGDLKDPRVLWLKGGLFVLLGGVALAVILLRHPDVWLGILLMVMIWAFCRAYYFAFYVLERYIDPGFRFAGLFSVMRHLARHGTKRPEGADSGDRSGTSDTASR